MSMIGELTFFLGFQVKQMKEGIFISQEKYTKDLLKRFNMHECKPIKTLFRSMIDSLLYLTASRSDIMFSVCMCARFQANPKEAHLIAVKESLGTLSTYQALVFDISKELDFN